MKDLKVMERQGTMLNETTRKIESREVVLISGEFILIKQKRKIERKNNDIFLHVRD